LLIIFMVTAPMLTQGVVVKLPSASTEPVPEQKEPIVVSVDAHGSYYIDSAADPKQAVDLAAVQGFVGKVVQQRPDVAIYVRGDQQVDYGKVVTLMAALQAVGAKSVGLITQPAEK
ncbi:MAG: ExbD/TolR family protein, partial [Pseudomonadales bacterium]|nr:ExbD/TolR family protein [Pseudomonadales bacterium]